MPKQPADNAVHAVAPGDRIVVAIGELPGGDQLVQAARRLADGFGAPWTALHIETPRARLFTDAEHVRLAETMHLATQLGAQVATIPAQEVLEGIVRFVAETRATQLIVGKSARSRWFELRHGSIVDRLVRDLPGLAVHVLPMDRTARPEQAGARTLASGGTALGYVVSLALTAAVTLLGLAIFSAGNITNVGLLFLLPVMVAATRYGMRTGIITSLVCSLAYNFFFIPPTHTFTIEDPQNIITLLVLLGVAIVGSQLASQVREQALMAQASAAQNSLLAGFARQLTGIRALGELAEVLCAEVARLLDVNTVLLIAEGDELGQCASVPAGSVLEMLDDTAARWSFDHNKPAGRGTDALSACEWLFYPVGTADRVMGVFGLARTDARPPVRSDQLPLLLSLIDQAGLALERIVLEQEMAGLAQVRERDRLRHALLSSVSHDLRTPLTTILGSLREIRAQSPEQEQQLAATRIEAERLHRFVANLLDMVRIEAGALHLSTDSVDLTEAVASALHDLRGLLKDQPVRVEIPPDLPLVRVDPQLFHHCLINLIENAAKHGGRGRPIRIVGASGDDGVDLIVSDQGPGIPAGEEARIFETFVRIEGSDRTGGTGLGLAIVKGFAEAMGLQVTAGNCPDGPGAWFTIRFPAERLKLLPD